MNDNIKIGQKIHLYRKAKKMTLEELAALCGVHHSTLSRYENGSVESVSLDTINKIAKALNVSLSDIAFVDSNINDLLPISVGSGYRLPIFKYIPASCGFGSWAEDDVLDYIILPSSIYRLNRNKKYFCQVAEGDSMIGANIQDGDLLIFEQHNIPENNMIGTFSINGEKCYCKRVKIVDNKIYLVSANDNYMPIEITPEMDFRMVGLLKYIVKEFNFD